MTDLKLTPAAERDVRANTRSLTIRRRAERATLTQAAFARFVAARLSGAIRQVDPSPGGAQWELTFPDGSIEYAYGDEQGAIEAYEYFLEEPLRTEVDG